MGKFNFEQELFNAASEKLTRQRTEFFKTENKYAELLNSIRNAYLKFFAFNNKAPNMILISRKDHSFLIEYYAKRQDCPFDMAKQVSFMGLMLNPTDEELRDGPRACWDSAIVDNFIDHNYDEDCNAFKIHG